MKKCKRCGRVLSNTKFYKHIATKDRLRPYCKTCMIIAKRPLHIKKMKTCSSCKRYYPRTELLTTSHGYTCYRCFTKKYCRV